MWGFFPPGVINSIKDGVLARKYLHQNAKKYGELLGNRYKDHPISSGSWEEIEYQKMPYIMKLFAALPKVFEVQIKII